ncbi:DNA/RNA non-specific endonuclease [Mucilaginibacter sp. RS28]|uniref:DNA/RNA non-specific endonuclease n=1 Tax=Mucilaginibacter straminoryzae TaxID=2932774 RepID=A0A9X1X5Y9_9SPHI|nr:DNA/RNA non-specific endonuclease [Mucilaginibacter straminoryzae]MCJ8211737.1 DNA/RNA non-specific endonuclease [Mucilaginibacter straminoryzae]
MNHHAFHKSSDRGSSGSVPLQERTAGRSFGAVSATSVQHLANNSTNVAQLRQLQNVATLYQQNQRQAIQLKHGKGCNCPGCAPPAQLKAMPGKSTVIQRYCDAPGCNDPNCHDPANHGMDFVRTLRNTTIYGSTIGRGNIGQGSGTSQQTRNYVQNPNAFYPEQVSIGYTNQSGSIQGYSSYNQPPLQPGEKPDAGHIFGNQMGGSGKDTANIFAQQKNFNRGNSYQGERTYESWRKTENEIRENAQKGEDMDVRVKLNKKQRPNYSKLSVEPEWSKKFMDYYYRKDDDDEMDGGTAV